MVGTKEMATYQLIWNPTESPGDRPALAEELRELAKGIKVQRRWSSGNRQDIKAGDRVFLLKQGRNSPGLMASGYVSRASYRGTHRLASKRAAGVMGLWIKVEWDYMVPEDRVLPRAYLLKDIIPENLLRAASSGVQYPPEVARRVEKHWKQHKKELGPLRFLLPLELSPVRFQQQFARFEDLVERGSGEPFRSFSEGLPDEWESYKTRLRDKALAILQPSDWSRRDVDRRGILEKLIAAVEIDESGIRNNLVQWTNRWGEADQSHRALLSARRSASRRWAIQRWCLDFFQDRLEPGVAFEQLQSLVGGRYDLLGYLFFLKDDRRFMPIAPKTFDKAFKLLGLDLVTSAQCAWSNYSRYNEALIKIWEALRDYAEVPRARLIDAHSFCWLLVRLNPGAVASEPVIPVLEAVNLVPFSRQGSSNDSHGAVDETFFEERDQRRRRLGLLAQQLALRSEIQRLRALRMVNPERSIRAVWNEPSRGYDILSKEEDGSPRHIEVKAARFSNNRYSFFLTENERVKAYTLRNYYFYLVLRADSHRPKVHVLAAAQLTGRCLTATTYIANLLKRY